MIVLLTLTTAGSDTGPFDLYTNLDGFTTPFLINISKASLTSGYLANTPDYTQTIRIKSTGLCVNYSDILLQNTTTTTTTFPVIPCNEDVLAGGAGITEYTVGLEPGGGLFVIAFNALNVPDKLELLHNTVKKATSSMSTPNEGPFDNLYGNPTVPTVAQTTPIVQFIGSSKGTIPNRQGTFASETGSSLLLPAGYQQLVWWQYTSTDYLLSPNIKVRITGPDGTAWSIQRLCEPEPTTTSTTSSSTSSTTTTTSTTFPPSFNITAKVGTFACIFGLMEVSPFTNQTIYSSSDFSTLAPGDLLYLDPGLTILLESDINFMETTYGLYDITDSEITAGYPLDSPC